MTVFDNLTNYLYYCAFMLNRLPELIDPLLLVEKREGFKGTIAIAKMKRLASLLVEASGSAELEIQFGRDSAGLAIATGTVSAVVRLQCQRCLEPMDFQVDSKFTLGVVASLSEASQLPDNYEPLIADQGRLSLAELVEDEILLALPAIAMHTEQCPDSDTTTWQTAAGNVREAQRKETESMYNAPSAESSRATDEEKPHPFAVLADLKKKLSK
jgi:uncharacterized protein